MYRNKIVCGDVLNCLATVPDDVFHCVVTSPPYYGKRKYPIPEQIGWERTPDDYVTKICDVFDEVKRVLHPTGVVWLNIGDCHDKHGDVMFIPYLVALELKQRGWRTRSDIKWCVSGGTYLYCKSQTGEMPITVKDLFRYDPKTIKLWNGKKWTQMLGISRSERDGAEIEFTLRSGEKISCTELHKFPTNRGLLEAYELSVGDIIQKEKLPEPENPVISGGINNDVAWFIGLYLAEGSRSGHAIQISGHKDEFHWIEKLQKIVDFFDGSLSYDITGNMLNIRIWGEVLRAVLDQYINGTNASSKFLMNNCWMHSDEWLKSLLLGYLEGDGSWDEKNNRWRLGFTRNYNLERNLRTICGRLNIRLTLNQSISTCQTGEFKSFRGEIRFENNGYMTEIVAISKARCRYVYDIGVEDDPHLYATLSGTLIHNSKPNCRPESVQNRPTCSHETILQLAKSKSYFFDHENVKEPLKHPGAVGMKFGGKKYPKNEQISNTTYSGNTYDAAALSGRRIRNSWYFPTAMYRGAHTATFPLILPEKCILASTSDHGACVACGMQYTRVVNKTGEVDVEWMKSCGSDSKGGYNGKSVKDYVSQGAEDASDLKRRVLESMRKKETIGWKKQCTCDTNMIVPSVVCDPFIGVGTSALAAIKNKRDYFGIDIDEKNVAIANERIEKLNKTGKI